MIQWKKKTFLNRQHFLPRVFCYNEKKSCGLLILTFPPKSKINCLINAVGLLLLFSPIIIISFFKYTVKQDRMIGNLRLIIILSHYNNIISYIFYKIKSSKISHDFLNKIKRDDKLTVPMYYLNLSLYSSSYSYYITHIVSLTQL